MSGSLKYSFHKIELCRDRSGRLFLSGSEVRRSAGMRFSYFNEPVHEESLAGFHLIKKMRTLPQLFYHGKKHPQLHAMSAPSMSMDFRGPSVVA